MCPAEKACHGAVKPHKTTTRPIYPLSYLFSIPPKNHNQSQAIIRSVHCRRKKRVQPYNSYRAIIIIMLLCRLQRACCLVDQPTNQPTALPVSTREMHNVFFVDLSVAFWPSRALQSACSLQAVSTRIQQAKRANRTSSNPGLSLRPKGSPTLQCNNTSKPGSRK